MSEAESDAYYNSRARISRLGAIASDQSRPLPSRAELEQRVAEYDARYPGDSIPRPPNWFGWRVQPEAMEFWQDMPFRLHDRRGLPARARRLDVAGALPVGIRRAKAAVVQANTTVS